MTWAAQPERGGALLARAAIFLARRGGWALGRALTLPATAWFLLTSARARSASRDYLGRVLGRPAGLGDVVRHFDNFACAVLDRVLLLSGHRGAYRIETQGLEEMLAVLARGRGCILLGAHLGSFEVLRSLAQSAPVPVWALMYRRNAGAMTRLLDQLSPGLRRQVLEIGDTASMIQARECIERGEIVGILADRSPPGHRVMPAPFLGAPAQFPSGPFILAATLGAPVFLFHGVRTGPRRYQVGFEPFADQVVLHRATRAADLRAYIHRYAAALERRCRAHPLNWFNFFPFWEHHDAQPHRRSLVLLLPLLAWPGRARADPFPLAELMARLAAVPSRRAAFREHRRFAALSTALESTGTLSYRRPDYLEKVTTWPQPERLVVDGPRLILTEANDPPRVVDLTGQPELRTLIEGMRGPLAGDLAALQRGFSIQGTGTLANWTLDLAPRDPAAARMLRTIRVGGEGDQVRDIRLTQANGDEQWMQIGPPS